jgi:hypothetical protein
VTALPEGARRSSRFHAIPIPLRTFVWVLAQPGKSETDQLQGLSALPCGRRQFPAFVRTLAPGLKLAGAHRVRPGYLGEIVRPTSDYASSHKLFG